jgi:drug/metabolite transporter (DMT)-like permease
VPARYVAGYFRRDDDATGPEAGHAWVEAHVPRLGWVGFDPVNEICVTDQHIRVAIGLDHLGAAPVRGAHYGGGREALAVKLVVAQAAGISRVYDSADAMLVLANVLWSLNYATTKYAFGEWLPLAFSATRFLCAGIIFALFVLWREGSLRIRRSDVKLVVATAAVGILLNQLTFNYAVDKTTAGNTALILASAPAFAALFASFAGHEHVQRKHWLALAVSVAGVVLVIQGGSGVAGVSLVGDLLAVGAAITWAAYSVMLRPLFGRYSAARISALMVSIGSVMLLPFGLPQIHEQDWAGISGLHWAAWGYSIIFPVLVTNLLTRRGDASAAIARLGAAFDGRVAALPPCDGGNTVTLAR